MSEISKCDGFIKDVMCPNKDNCLRYNIKSDDLWQSWIRPDVKDNGQCRSFLRDYGKDQKRN